VFLALTPGSDEAFGWIQMFWRRKKKNDEVFLSRQTWTWSKPTWDTFDKHFYTCGLYYKTITIVSDDPKWQL
jgi:hypothetical protein